MRVEHADLPRVAFGSNALLPGYLSSQLIGECLQDTGRNWPDLDKGEVPGLVEWFSFPVIPPPRSHAQPVRVDFDIVPVFGPRFFRETKGENKAYTWAEFFALRAVLNALRNKVPLTIGWGAFMKNATDHGEVFLDRHPELARSVTTTHGDAGTVHLLLETIRLAEFKPGFRVAVIGANGAIGDLVSRTLPRLRPEAIVLVGRADKPGERKNLDRLEVLQSEVRLDDGEVLVSQDAITACVQHRVNLVILATNGDVFQPSMVNPGTLVLDITTPAATRQEDNWQGKLVLTSGCGHIPEIALPERFGLHRRAPLRDVGAGGDLTLWGCTLETIARAMYGFKGHVVGSHIPIEELEWCEKFFPPLGFAPQAPVSFGRTHSWEHVAEFVRHSAPPPSRSRVALSDAHQ
jgi:hypothetical protein